MTQYPALIERHYGEHLRSPLGRALLSSRVAYYEYKGTTHLEKYCYVMPYGADSVRHRATMAQWIASSLPKCTRCVGSLEELYQFKVSALHAAATWLLHAQQDLAALTRRLPTRAPAIASRLAALASLQETTEQIECGTTPAARVWRDALAAEAASLELALTARLRTKQVRAQLIKGAQTALLARFARPEELGWNHAPVLLGTVGTVREHYGHGDLVGAVLAAFEVARPVPAARVLEVPQCVADFLWRYAHELELHPAPLAKSPEHLDFLARLWEPGAGGVMASLAVAHRQALNLA